jgi:hypothetical protein
VEAKKELNALYEKASWPIGHKHIALAREHAAAGRLKDAQREYVIAVVAGNLGDPPDALAGFIASRYRMTRADFDSFARYGTPKEITFDGGSLVAPDSDPQVGSDYADEVKERRSFEGQNAIRAGVRMSVAGLTGPCEGGYPGSLLARRCCLPRYGPRWLPQRSTLSGLIPTARTLAVYASRRRLPGPAQDSLPAGRPTLPDGTFTRWTSM